MTQKHLPNLVFIVADQWRSDATGHSGNPAARTPTLDKLAGEEAVSFPNTFCQNPVCVPSRCSMLTALYPHTRGHRSMFYPLHPEHGETDLLEVLKKAGYFVWWGGKNDLYPANCDPVKTQRCDIRFTMADASQVQGVSPDLHAPDYWEGKTGGERYSMYLGPLKAKAGHTYRSCDDAIIDKACHFIKQHPRSEQPFALLITLQYPHPPYGVEETYLPSTDQSAIPPPPQWQHGPEPLMQSALRERQNLKHWTSADWQALKEVYHSMCLKVDTLIGLIINCLKKEGVWDDTVLAVTSDHGDFTGDYGLVEKAQNLFPDCLTRVPLILKSSRHHPCKPGIRNSLVELIDLPVTLCELLGIEPDPSFRLFGCPLTPLLARDIAHRQAAFCEGGRLMEETWASDSPSGCPPPSNLYWPRSSLQTHPSIPYNGKACMIRTDNYKYVHRFYEENQFFDLIQDPAECHNQIHNPSYANTIRSMQLDLLNWYMKTCDITPTNVSPRSP